MNQKDYHNTTTTTATTSNTVEEKEEWYDEIEETFPQMTDKNTTSTNIASKMQTKLTLQEKDDDDKEEECSSSCNPTTKQQTQNNNHKKKNPSYKYDNDPIEDDERIPGIKFVNYHDESQLESVMKLVGKDLSEPYSGMFKCVCECFVRLLTFTCIRM